MMGALTPMHHGDATDSDANLVQRFVDSDAGNVLGTFLHTTGALLFTAGIILYLYQARLVKAAARATALPSLKVLPLAHGFNLVGIALNGIGGLMRLYQSDHPGIDQLATSPWVQLLLVKHLFLIAGVGLAVYLTYRTHTLALADEAPGNFFPETKRIQWFAAGSFATILMASVLGAAATGVTLPGAVTPMDTNPQDEHEAHAGTITHFANATASITGTPLQQGKNQHAVLVQADDREIYGELNWTNTQGATLELSLFDPSGNRVVGPKTGTGRVDLSHRELVTGTWYLVVTSSRAIDERYTLVGRSTSGGLEDTYTVNPKASRGIVEINLEMKVGDRINWTWSVVDSTQALDFNIHLHVGSDVSYPIRGTWTSLNGTYVHESTNTDGVSLMWENPSSTGVKVHYRIEGKFTVVSKFIR